MKLPVSKATRDAIARNVFRSEQEEVEVDRVKKKVSVTESVGAWMADDAIRHMRQDNAKLAGELGALMKIDEHALDEAIIQQPDAFYRVSKMLAMSISMRDGAKQELAEEEAQTDQHLRRAAAQENTKHTAQEIAAMVAIDKDVKAAARRLLNANAEVLQLQALKDAFTARSFALRDLVSLHVTGYFGDTTGRSARNDAASRKAEGNKQRMAEMRRSRGTRDE